MEKEVAVLALAVSMDCVEKQAYLTGPRCHQALP